MIRQIGEKLGEAGDQIALGEHRIDGKIDLEALMQFNEPRPDCIGMGRDVGRRQRHQILKADGDQDAVDRLARPVLL